MHKIIGLLLIICYSSNVFSQTTDASGKKQGYWKKKDEKTSKLLYEGLFKDNKPQGVFKYYYPNDTLKALMNFKQDGKIAYSTLFHANGKKMAVGKYINEIKDSVWLYYDEKGILISKETLVDGKKNGTVYIYLPDGTVSEEKNFKLDVQHGAFKQYYNPSMLKGEGTYVNGQLDGKNSFYYPNGVVAATGFYRNGFKNGPWIYKTQDGKIKEKELYKNGKLASSKETEEFFNKNKVADDKPQSTDTKTTTTKPKTNTTKPKTTK